MCGTLDDWMVGCHISEAGDVDGGWIMQDLQA